VVQVKPPNPFLVAGVPGFLYLLGGKCLIYSVIKIVKSCNSISGNSLFLQFGIYSSLLTLVTGESVTSFSPINPLFLAHFESFCG